MEYAKCFLPGGYIDDAGRLHREVELAPLSGREEELLANTAHRGGAVQVTSILSRCVKRIGDMDTISEQLVRQLLVADRQYLMLKLRELTFGERVQATVSCPWPDCGAAVDIKFNIADVPVKEAEMTGREYEYSWPETTGEVTRTLWFRLPNGGDQEALSAELSENEALATTHLLARCIQRIDDIRSPDMEQIRDLPTRLRNQIEQQMQTLAPDVELTMEANCPECQRDFSIPFDLQEFFFGELKTSQELLRREIHYLAYHYHWSEQDILAMTREKRQGYIEVLAEEIDRLNAEVQNSAVR